MTKQYSTQEAIAYLKEKGVEVSLDTFYHKIERQKYSYAKVSVGKRQCYRFTQAELDALNFMRSGEYHPFDNKNIVDVRSADDILSLSAEHGDIVDDKGFLAAIYDRYGIEYDVKSLRHRRYRGTVQTVGKSGKTYWYPLRQLEHLRFSTPRKKKQRVS